MPFKTHFLTALSFLNVHHNKKLSQLLKLQKPSFAINTDIIHRVWIFAVLKALILSFALFITIIKGTESRPIVPFSSKYEKGSIVIVNNTRRLYYVMSKGRAMRYPIAVGKPKAQWTGHSFVQSKRKNPIWIPPWQKNKRVKGGPNSPLGVRAIYLGWTLYRIHGTNEPRSIGKAASHGCFRMLNRDVSDLYKRVHISAPVHIINRL